MRPPFLPGRGQRLKWWWDDIRGARFTPVLATGLLAVEVLLYSKGGAASQVLQPVYANLGLSMEGVMSGRIWQPMTYGFLHGGWTHLLLNLLLLVSTGVRVERIAGAGTAARVFSAGILAGGAVFLLLPAGDLLLVGASGGIFALLLWLTTVSPDSRMAPLPVSARNLGLGILIASGAMALIVPWLPAGGIPISHSCHFGGALAGCLMARWKLRLPKVAGRRPGD